VQAASGGDWGWILHGRPRLNLAMRLTTRAHELISRGGAARGNLRASLALASAGLDLALVAHLRRSRHSETGVHLAVDAADLAAWTALSTTDGYSQLATAMNSSHPMAIEAGARYGALGLGVPLLNAAVAGAVSRARGRRVQLAPWVWQAAAAGAGMGLSRYARRRRDRQLATHEALVEPELVRAELTGLNDEALGLGNVFDEIQRAVTLVRLAPARAGASAHAGTARSPDARLRTAIDAGAAGWKADVADRTRRTHVYLADLLVRWQQHHNRRTDLGAVVALTLDPAIAPVVVRAEEADRLWTTLDRLDVRGRLGVTVRARRADQLALAIGDHDIEVTTAAPAPRLAFDPLPGGFAWMALWLAAAGPRDGVGPAAALGPAGAALALMWWSHRRGSDRRRDRDGAVLASTALAVLAGVAQTRFVGTTHIPNPHVAGGIPRVPASLALRGHAFVTELCRPEARRSTLVVAHAATVATLAACRLLTPHPRPVREFVAEATWIVMSASMARAFTEGIERESAELEAEVASHDRERIDAHRAQGRDIARQAATQMLNEAETLVTSIGGDLDDDVRAEVRRRLDACAAQLAR
jgi:hypothetical protein